MALLDTFELRHPEAPSKLPDIALYARGCEWGGEGGRFRRLQIVVSEVLMRTLMERPFADFKRLEESLVAVADNKGWLQVGHSSPLTASDRQLFRDVWSRVFEEEADLVEFRTASRGEAPPSFHETAQYRNLGLYNAPTDDELKWSGELEEDLYDEKQVYDGHYQAQLIAAQRWQQLLKDLSSLTESDSVLAEDGATFSLTKAGAIAGAVFGVTPTPRAIQIAFEEQPEAAGSYRIDPELDVITLPRLSSTLMLNYQRGEGIVLGTRRALKMNDRPQ